MRGNKHLKVSHLTNTFVTKADPLVKTERVLELLQCAVMAEVLLSVREDLMFEVCCDRFSLSLKTSDEKLLGMKPINSSLLLYL